MSISINCDHCFQQLRFPEKAAGKRTRCKYCKEIIQVPAGTTDDEFLNMDLDQYDNPAPRKRPQVNQQQQKSKSSSRGSSTLQDMFENDSSVAMKMLGGAVATPLIVIAAALRAQRRNSVGLPTDPFTLILAIGGAAILARISH